MEQAEKMILSGQTKVKVKSRNTGKTKKDSGKPYREKMIFTRELKGGVYC